MSAALLDAIVGRVCLHARLIEGAVHRPDGWTVKIDGELLPVTVASDITDESVSAVFMAGPVPPGRHFYELLCDGVPMYVGEHTMNRGQWWEYALRVTFPAA